MSTSLAGEPWPYPSVAANYVYIQPTTSINTRICQRCQQWIFDGQSHVCTQITFTSIETVPYKCPCCDGWGQRDTAAPLDSVSKRMETCRGCNGSGVIWRQLA